jgi:hypothetical protein
MALPEEVEECLDVLQVRILEKELRETETLISENVEPSDILAMQKLHRILTGGLAMEGRLGREFRRYICEEIAWVKHNH